MARVKILAISLAQNWAASDYNYAAARSPLNAIRYSLQTSGRHWVA